MTRVLVLAYHYPPLGGAAVQRNRLVDRLPALGFEPTVITGTGRADGRWAPADPGSREGAPAGIEVRRAAGPEPPPSSGRRRQLEGLLDRRSRLGRWWDARAVEAASACRDWAFRELPIDELYAKVRSTNVASMNVAIRLGMTVRRTFTTRYRGVDMPHLAFAVSRAEWAARR